MSRVERRPGFTLPHRLPGHLLRWDDDGGMTAPARAGLPVRTVPGDMLPGEPVRFELTPRGWLTLSGLRLREDAGASTLWKVRRDPPGLSRAGAVGEPR